MQRFTHLRVEQPGIGLDVPEATVHAPDPDRSGVTLCGRQRREMRREHRNLAMSRGPVCGGCRAAHQGNADAVPDGGEPDDVSGGVGTPVIPGVRPGVPLALVDTSAVPLGPDEVEITPWRAAAGAISLTALVAIGVVS